MSHYFTDVPTTLTNQGKGRPKGSLNKSHAVVRWGLTEAYRRLGGVDGLVKWGKTHRTEFYTLLCKLIPAEIADQHGAGDTKIQVVILPPGHSQSHLTDIASAGTGEFIHSEGAEVEEAGGSCRQDGVALREPEA